MYDELKNMLEGFAALDVGETANFRAMLKIREKLRKRLRMRREALDRSDWAAWLNRFVLRMKINLPVDLSDEELDGLIQPFCECLLVLIHALLRHGFDWDAILEVANDLNLELKGD